jgi:hypothetical protein
MRSIVFDSSQLPYLGMHPPRQAAATIADCSDQPANGGREQFRSRSAHLGTGLRVVAFGLIAMFPGDVEAEKTRDISEVHAEGHF